MQMRCRRPVNTHAIAGRSVTAVVEAPAPRARASALLSRLDGDVQAVTAAYKRVVWEHTLVATRAGELGEVERAIQAQLVALTDSRAREKRALALDAAARVAQLPHVVMDAPPELSLFPFHLTWPGATLAQEDAATRDLMAATSRRSIRGCAAAA